MSKQPKHTPAPWRAVNTLKDTPNGHLSYRVEGAWDSSDIVVLIKTNNEADARLIAAAPKMLEALEQICDEVTDLTYDQLCLVKNAIRKARGG